MGDSQILFISDIEGCIVKDSNGKDQSYYFCSETFFESLGNFLEKNQKNKVAFLGDYFDEGPGVVESIKGIAKLHKKYLDRVYIILGNRDLNKFRLAYEDENYYHIFLTMNVKYPEGFLIHKGLKDIYDTPTPDKRNDIEKVGLHYLVKVFSETKAEKICNKDFIKSKIDTNLIAELEQFVQDCRYVLFHGKIVAYDEDYKVLLCHGGGITPAMFNINIENMHTQFDEKTTTIGLDNIFDDYTIKKNSGQEDKSLQQITQKTTSSPDDGKSAEIEYLQKNFKNQLEGFDITEV